MSFKKHCILISIFLSLLHPLYAAPSTKGGDNDVAIQNAVLVYINEYRHHHRLSPLKMDNNIVREAKQHSQDMAHHKMPFGHKYFIKRINKLRTQIKNSGAGAENVAYNYKDAHTVVQQWVLSPGHKRNIVGNYNLTGIGIARDKQGKIYYTQIFLKTGQNQQSITRRHFFGVPFAGASFKRAN